MVVPPRPEVVVRVLPYPEPLPMPIDLRREWHTNYVETIVQRDIGELSSIRKLASLAQMLSWTAANSGNELSISSASRDLAVDREALSGYIEWLERVFLLRRLPPWSSNLVSRTIKRPKIHLTDSGLASALTGVSTAGIAKPGSPMAGPLLESFIVNEVDRQLSIAEPSTSQWHYRDRNQREVDLVLGRADGALIAMEFKATTSPRKSQLRHLEWLRDLSDSKRPGTFRAGIILHTGTHSLTAGDRMYYRPIA